MADGKSDDPKTLKGLDALVGKMQRKYGAGAISVFGRNQVVVERVPLDSFYLSELFGGGYPRGRMIEIYGPESSGKTTLACYLGGQCQRNWFEDKGRHGVVAYVDVEHALDPSYAETFGLRMDSVLFSQPDSAEQALDIVNDLVESGLVDMVIVDSVAALVPQAEIDGEMGDQQMGLLARLMGKACRKLQAMMGPKSATIVWINQIRFKMTAYGNPETTPGGNALKFFAAVRLVTRLGERIESGDAQIGMTSKIKSIKNKIAPPFRSCEMKIIFGGGYQVEEEYVEAFTKHGIISKSGGGWYSLRADGGEPEKVQGDGRVMEWLKAHPAEYAAFKSRLMAALSRKTTAVVVEDSDADESAVVEEQERLERGAMEADGGSDDAASVAEEGGAS